MDYLVLVRVQCLDAMITIEINLLGLAQVEDECKTQKKIYRVRDLSIMTLYEDQNIFLVTSFNSKSVETNKFIRKHAIKLTLITFKDEYEWTQCFSQQYANHCLRYVFSIVAY